MRTDLPKLRQRGIGKFGHPAGPGDAFYAPSIPDKAPFPRTQNVGDPVGELEISYPLTRERRLALRVIDSAVAEFENLTADASKTEQSRRRFRAARDGCPLA